MIKDRLVKQAFQRFQEWQLPFFLLEMLFFIEIRAEKIRAAITRPKPSMIH
jgi:hypothetical protein